MSLVFILRGNWRQAHGSLL